MLQIIKANNLGCTSVIRYYKVTEAMSNNLDVLKSVADGTLLENNIIDALDDKSAAILANVILETVPDAQVCAINVAKFPVVELTAHIVPTFEWCFSDEGLLAAAKELEGRRKDNEIMVIVTYKVGTSLRLVARKSQEKPPASPPSLDSLTMEDNVAQEDTPPA
jgi:hypothetical protein